MLRCTDRHVNLVTVEIDLVLHENPLAFLKLTNLQFATRSG